VTFEVKVRLGLGKSPYNDCQNDQATLDPGLMWITCSERLVPSASAGRRSLSAKSTSWV
jgi:hypothetical protein